jgi:hypothetical protein
MKPEANGMRALILMAVTQRRGVRKGHLQITVGLDGNESARNLWHTRRLPDLGLRVVLAAQPPGDFSASDHFDIRLLTALWHAGKTISHSPLDTVESMP